MAQFNYEDDLKLARELQEEENKLQREREENIRKRNQELQNPLQQQQQIRTPHPSAAVTRLVPGQVIAIRLQHPATGNQIDEPMYAHCADRGLMMFELVRNRDTYMRTKSNGKIEFSITCDDKARYFVESAPNGTIYLTAKGHLNKQNIAGNLNWFISLTPEGALVGNADRTPLSQWRLVASSDSPPFFPTQMQQLQGGPFNITVSTGTSSSSSTASPPRYDTSPAAPSLNKKSKSQAQLDTENDSPSLQISVDQQMKWLTTRVGQMFLQRDPRLMKMYQDGNLQKVLHRPDWHQVALNWKDYQNLPIPYNPMNNNILSINHIQWFFDQGYTKVDKIIPQSYISSALRVINFWLGHNPLPKVNLLGNIDLTGAILTDPNLMELLYETPLIDMIQTLLGIGNMSPCLECGISLRYPQLTGDNPNSGVSNSKKLELGGKRWRVDNSNPKTPISKRYSVLAAIPLNETTKPYEGNFCVFPGGHDRVYDILLERALKNNNSTTTTNNPSTPEFDLSDELDMNKPDIGEPIQILSSPGDVIFLPGELTPHRDSPNYSCNIRYMVYFRISIEIPVVYETSIVDGMWSLYNPSIAPKERKKKSVIAALTEDAFIF